MQNVIPPPGESKQVQAFGGLWNKKYETDIQTEMLIHQSQSNLDEKILFGKIAGKNLKKSL